MVFMSTISGERLNEKEDVIVRLTAAEFMALASLEGGADRLPTELLWAIRTMEQARQAMEVALKALTAVPSSMVQRA